ncbi:MAG: Copper-exporting P-type ATPase A [Cryomorphaceae bacterium]|nr:MAG: Copper-exporting P-type ATPase A [Cryomorphaceae bacterium]
MKNESKKVKIQIEGMTCTNCAAGIKKHLINKGLEDVNVNFSTSEASCNIDASQDQNDVENIIKKLGYSIIKPNKEIKKRISKVERYFYSTLIFTLPLFSHMFFPEGSFIQNPILQFFLCLPVYLIGVTYFGKSAWSSLKTGIPNMDVLIFIGSSAAFFYSIYGWLIFGGTAEMHHYLFFETTATIVTLVLLGNVLEHKSVQKTTTAIGDLSSIQEVIAKIEVNGIIKEVSFDDIKVGDILAVNSGDKIPTDGIIVSGSAYIDESMITGESIPTNKSKDANVIGGTIITDGNVKIKASKVGSDTLLSQIIELVKNAQNNKPNIQKLGDQVSAVFVPVVLSIAILTFFIGHYYFSLSTQEALLRGIAVLVISCPCAMGLATPTAVMVGIGRAAKNGILIKGGDSLEKLASIKSIVFDKTGTLTTGKFIVSNFNAMNEDEEKIKNIIFNIEQHSSHPIAKSLCSAFKENSSPLELNNIIEEKGVSISAKIDEDLYTIGSSNIHLTDEKHDLFVLKNNKLIATLDISDELKTNTDLVISSLNKTGYTTTLLSGDKKNKCDKLSIELGITTTFSEQLPKDKIAKVEELVNQYPTAMLGDGINDAPALAKATIGISLGNATQIAIQSADVVLLNNENLEQLPQALQVGKHTLLTIKQNLFWAFSYNLVAIPIAFLGFLNPMWAALFMAFSDVIVIGNSIRLRYKKIF